MPGPVPVPTIKPKSNLRKELHTLLSDDAAVALFRESLSGFVARQSTIDRMHLTKKQYHPRLAKLVELGLIAKVKGTTGIRQNAKPNVTTYLATPLGVMIYRWHVKLCDEMAANATQIGVIFDLLNRHPDALSEKQTEDLASSLLIDAESLSELFLRHEGKYDIQILEDEKALIEAVCDMVAHATTRVQAIAPAFTDEVVKSLSVVARAGISVFALVQDSKNFETHDAQTTVQPPADIIYPGSPLGIKFKQTRVENSFVTVDDHFVVIRQTNPLDGSFLYGIKIRSDKLAVKYGSVFQGLWYGAQNVSGSARRATEQPPAKSSV